VSPYITEDIFGENNNFVVCNGIKNFFEKYGTIPNVSELITSTNNNSEAIKYVIKTCKDIETDFNDEYLFEEAEKFLKERMIMAALRNVSDDVMNDTLDTQAVLPIFESATSVSLMTDPGVRLFADIKYIADEINKPFNTISSGYEFIDNRLNGGFAKEGKAIYMFAGPPNVGKSIFLGNIARNIARQGLNVLVISLEMSEILYSKRIINVVGQVTHEELTASSLQVQQTMKTVKEEENYGEIYIKEFPTASLTVLQLKSYIENLQSTHGKLDAVVVDYLNILKPSRGNNSYENYKAVCEDLRALTYYFKMPIISATQFNRSAATIESPKMEHLAESYGVAMTADVIFSIFRTPEDYEMNFIKLGIARNRIGSVSGIAVFECDFSRMTLVETDELDENDIGEDEDSIGSTLASFTDYGFNS
tara:strand:- start:6032 stop:7294 length:1263 start_codon:yes stop_codon:yes gene_type:complete